MIGPILTVAQIAAEQYRVRQARAQTTVRNGGMSRAQAERHLRPWLAIACTVGASLPEIETLIAGIEDDQSRTPHKMPPGTLRWLAAEEICPRRTWAPVLTLARDTAFDRFIEVGDEATLNSATSLQRIALVLQHDINGDHVPPYTSRATRQQALAA